MAFPTGWTQLARIDAQSSQVSGSGNLTNFPALIKDGNLPANVYSNIESDGKDLRFTTDSAGTTEVSFEIVSITPASSLCEIWLKIPTLDYNDDTPIYVWGNNASATAYAATDTYGSQAVWSANYKSVLHLQEASGSALDSTSNGINGTFAGDLPDSKAGQIGNGQDLDGTGDYLNLGDVNAGIWDGTNAVLTASAWIKPDAVDSHHVISSKYYYNSGTATYHEDYRFRLSGDEVYAGVFVDGSGFNCEAETTDAVNIATDGIKYYVVATFDLSQSTGNKIKIYVNGAEATSTNAASSPPTAFANSTIPVEIGAWNYHNVLGSHAYPFDGIIDEHRFYKGVQTADWIATEYANQNSPSTFWTQVSTGGKLLGLLGVGN